MARNTGTIPHNLHSNIKVYRGEVTSFINPFYSAHLVDQGVNTAPKETEVNIFDFIRTQVLAVLAGEFFASWFGGFIILYTAALAGATTGVVYDASALGLGVGLGVFVACAAFGHVSGGHANPSLTAILFVMNVLHYIRSAPFTVVVTRFVLLISAWIAQFAGWIVAAACVYYSLHENDTNTGIGLPRVNPAGINGDTVHLGRAFFAETIASTIFYCVFAFGIVDRKSLFPSLEMGLTVTAITIALGGHTGGVMNAMRWFCTAIIKNEFNDDWTVYLWPPIIAGIFAVILAEIWRRFIEPISPGSDPEMVTAPQFPPHNKHMENRKEDHKMTNKPKEAFTIDPNKFKDERARVFTKARRA